MASPANPICSHLIPELGLFSAHGTQGNAQVGGGGRWHRRCHRQNSDLRVLTGIEYCCTPSCFNFTVARRQFFGGLRGVLRCGGFNPRWPRFSAHISHPHQANTQVNGLPWRLNANRVPSQDNGRSATEDRQCRSEACSCDQNRPRDHDVTTADSVHTIQSAFYGP